MDATEAREKVIDRVYALAGLRRGGLFTAKGRLQDISEAIEQAQLRAAIEAVERVRCDRYYELGAQLDGGSCDRCRELAALREKLKALGGEG